MFNYRHPILYVANILGRRASAAVGYVIILFGVTIVFIGYHIIIIIALFIVSRIVLGFGLGIA